MVGTLISRSVSFQDSGAEVTLLNVIPGLERISAPAGTYTLNITQLGEEKSNPCLTQVDCLDCGDEDECLSHAGNHSMLFDIISGQYTYSK